MKGVTPVIALVMLMLITVGIVGASATWFSGTFTSQTKKFVSIPPGGAYCAGGDIKVYALNNGDTAITASDIIVAQVDGNDVLGTPFFGDMKNYMAGYWKFDEGSGTTASDNSGTAPPNTGTLTNMDTATVWVAGKSGRALKFDGVNDYVNVPDSASLTISGPITVSAWVNFKSFTNIIEAIASKNAVSNGWTLEKEAASNALSFWINSANRATTDVLSLNTWYHITGTFDGSNIKIYRDGVRKATTAQGSSTASAGSLRIGVAALDANRFFDGVIDEVKIYNKAIGDVNIQPGSSGLVINYPGLEGKHAIKIGTSSNVAEAGVTCV